MANMSGVVEQLRKELERAKNEVEQLGAALLALNGTYGKGTRTRGRISAAGRAKIAAAQRARWAKQKGQAARPKRVVSATARRKIAAAQRARWAKVKGQKKAA